MSRQLDYFHLEAASIQHSLLKQMQLTGSKWK